MNSRLILKCVLGKCTVMITGLNWLSKLLVSFYGNIDNPSDSIQTRKAFLLREDYVQGIQ